MTRLGFRLVHAANLLVAVSGVVYAWMLYALEPEDEFALWNHPWQGAVRDLHIVAAPLLVLLVGAAAAVHALPRLRGDGDGATGRATGLAMLVTFLPMALSGSLLQTSVSPAWTTVWLSIHLAASALWCAAAAVHVVLVRQSRRRSSCGAAPGSRSGKTCSLPSASVTTSR